MTRALIVDDSPNSRSGLSEWLGQQGLSSVNSAATVQQARKAIDDEKFDLVLLDLELPDGNGLDLLDNLEKQPDAEVVVITAHGSIDSAIKATRGGVIEYLTKPIDLGRLRKIVKNLLGTLSRKPQASDRFGGMRGSSPAIRKVYDLISRVAQTSSTVLVTGETGTGKELVARAVHDLSERSSGPFLPVNCGAIAPNLVESELFGHERGSFTGAERRYRGIFERASGGSLFLDEITEMRPELQVKLLRVLETGSVTRLGGDREIRADVRVIAATNRDLEEAAGEGKLRRDLMYRLNVFPIAVPPLRERDGDVLLLADHFLGELNQQTGGRKRLGDDARERLDSYAWPGNVRELRNLIERAYIVAGDAITADCLAQHEVPGDSAADCSMTLELGSSVAEVERTLILATLEHLEGDKKKAAEVLGVSLKTLYNRLNVYEERG